MSQIFSFDLGDSPIVAAAIHDGHKIRTELRHLLNLDEKQRLREEDPYTARWLQFADNKIVFHHSRFETDVNRPPDKAIYRKPEDAWGLKVWKKELPDEVVERSIKVYNDFYKQLKKYFNALFEMQEKIVVYDIHSYNYRRDAIDKVADAAENPEINIGTNNMDYKIWYPLIETIIKNFSSFNYAGRKLDVRENIKFKGGYFGQWLYKNYGKKICPISIEFKKFFMDEWTGMPFPDHIECIGKLLMASRQPVMDALYKIKI